MLTQEQLELETYQHGKNRTAYSLNQNEDKGRANMNPYAQAVFRRFVLPLAEVIRQDLAHKGPGRRQAHVQLLAPIDPEAVAFIAVRGVLNSLLSDGDAGARKVTHEIGRSVYHEYCLLIFQEAEPDLFYTLTSDFGRRLSTSERHRMTVFKMQAKANGIEFNEWGLGNTDQVGGYLIDVLESLGMVTTSLVKLKRGRNLNSSIEVFLTEEVLQIVSKIKDRVIETSPYFLPCVEEPRDWTSLTEGGFHTKEMRRMHPFLVRCRSSQRDHFKSADLSTEMTAINHLQKTKWRVNPKVLQAVKDVSRHFDMDEILAQADFPAPPRPPFLDVIEKEHMSAEQLQEFTTWKREKAEWHTQMKLRGTRFGRFTQAVRVANQFLEYPRIYFVYFADFRGRKYAQTTGINPQGSDLQKSLLEFAEGLPLKDENAVRWFKIHGANKYGVDKSSLDDRVKWVDEHSDMLVSFATDPVGNNAWTESDKPLQFLAWCFEYAEWLKDPNFPSRVAVGMDGSCNGLQNFSAMLRDEVGGLATNLIPGVLPRDIYNMVAQETMSLLTSLHTVQEPNSILSKWINHGMTRNLVKRSVMTLPYGSTRFSCADFIVDDYLKRGMAVEFAKEEYSRAATLLSHFVWEAIAAVVVKAREAMDWLQAAARQLVSEGIKEIDWVTPSGFPAVQSYWETKIHRIRSRLHGGSKLVMLSDLDTADKRKHSNGISPNFIHSLDASHLTLTTVACGSPQTPLHRIDDLAMVHDDYGTHAANAQRLYEIIREVFISMYSSNDPLADLCVRYPSLPAPPAKGNLDINLVRDSLYFFS